MGRGFEKLVLLGDEIRDSLKLGEGDVEKAVREVRNTGAGKAYAVDKEAIEKLARKFDNGFIEDIIKEDKLKNGEEKEIMSKWQSK